MIINSVKDRSIWLNLIRKFPIHYQDIYFHPDYITLNCNKKDSGGYLFYNVEGKKIWINSFIKIKVPSFNNLLNKQYYDL